MPQSNQCGTCKHYQGDMRCDAFPYPKRIPQKIVSGLFDHRKPYPGDNGVRWEPVEEADK